MAVCHISVSHWNTGLDTSLEKEVRQSKIQSFVPFEIWDSEDSYLAQIAEKEKEKQKQKKNRETFKQL